MFDTMLVCDIILVVNSVCSRFGINNACILQLLEDGHRVHSKATLHPLDHWREFYSQSCQVTSYHMIVSIQS